MKSLNSYIKNAIKAINQGVHLFFTDNLNSLKFLKKYQIKQKDFYKIPKLKNFNKKTYLLEFDMNDLQPRNIYLIFCTMVREALLYKQKILNILKISEIKSIFK